MKQVKIILFMGLLLVLAACSTGQKRDGTLKDAEPSNIETGLLNVVGEDAFVYHLDLTDEEAEEIHATADYYENGEFKNHAIDFSTGTDSLKDETSSLLFISEHVDDEHIKWTSSVTSDDGQASSTSTKIPMDSPGRASGSVPLPQPLYVNEKK